MSIVHVHREKSLAPEERNVLLTKPSISLLQSFEVLRIWFYKHLVPPGLKPTKKQTESFVQKP